jgi:hypothetical protein
MNKKDSKKTHKILIVVLTVLTLSAIVLVIGFSQLAARRDGTENYTGAKLEAAQAVLDRGLDDIYIVQPPGMKPYVDSVTPTPKSENEGSGLNCSNDPNDPSYYSATIRYVWLFGITISTHHINACNLAA